MVLGAAGLVDVASVVCGGAGAALELAGGGETAPPGPETEVVMVPDSM